MGGGDLKGAGCVEHATMILEHIQRAKAEERVICCVVRSGKHVWVSITPIVVGNVEVLRTSGDH